MALDIRGGGQNPGKKFPGVLMKRVGGNVALIAFFLAVAWTHWESPASGSQSAIDIMPSAWRSAGTVYDYGLHFDEGDPGRGAYDYSPPDGGSVWLRGMAATSQTYPARYRYWAESGCVIRARLQRLVGGTWVDYPAYDLRLVHVTNGPSSPQFTVAVSSAGQWFYNVVGNVSTCGGGSGSHSHLSAPVGSVAVSPKSNDTCWSDNPTACSIGSVRKHNPLSTCPPGNWSGYAAVSGAVSQYICATWMQALRSVDHPAFRIQ